MAKITYDRYSAPYFSNKKFHNYPGEKPHTFFLSSLGMFFYSRFIRLFAKKIDKERWRVPFVYSPNAVVPYITWLGHSTFLIQFDGITIITDPIFGNASFLFNRIIQSEININAIPIDYIVISHNHRDHMDTKSLRVLQYQRASSMVPLGVGRWCKRKNFENYYEHTWWQASTFIHGNHRLEFTFLPAHHWSQRTLFDRNRSLWGSWMISYKNYHIYFAGDTAYADHFKIISNEFPEIDVALLPIGPCTPRRLMRHAHIGAEEAIEAFLDLNARCFIPMHWGTFYFGTDSFDTPLEHLLRCIKQKNISMESIKILKFGELFTVTKNVSLSEVVPPKSLEVDVL